MRNIRILCRNHKNSLLRPEIKYFRPGREFLSSLSMFLLCNNQICLHCFSSVIKENLPATLQGDFLTVSLFQIFQTFIHTFNTKFLAYFILNFHQTFQKKRIKYSAFSIQDHLHCLFMRICFLIYPVTYQGIIRICQ